MNPIPIHQDSSAGLEVDALIGQLGESDRAVMETYLSMLAEAELTGKSADVTQLEVASEMGVSRATVNRAMNKLRALVT
jgi:predicted transcriptional regulator